MSATRTIRSLFRPGGAGRSGAVAIQVGIMLVAIIGFVSLGTEIVLLLATSRHMQSAADAGVLAAVSARSRGYPADYTQEALAFAVAAGFVNGVDGTTVQINSPPASGNFTTASGAVEVVIAQPQTLPLASIFHPDPFVVRARSVARSSGNGACILALDGAASGSLPMNGATVANFTNCGVSVNSTSAQAVSLLGGAILNTSHLDIVGGYSLSGGATINATDGIKTGAAVTPDPYASYVMPPLPAGPCLQTGFNPAASITIPAGIYCDGIFVRAGVVVTLAPGTYWIAGGTLSVTGTGSLLQAAGAGVTIVLTRKPPTYPTVATVSITAGATVNLAAPATGPTAGLVIFQDRAASDTGPATTNEFNGGAGQSFTGALYFPRQTIRFGGGTVANITCIEIVSRAFTFLGKPTLKLDCTGVGVVPRQLGKLQLTLRSLNEAIVPDRAGRSEPTWGTEVSRALRSLSGEPLPVEVNQNPPAAPVAVHVIRGGKSEQRCFWEKTGQSVDCGGTPAIGVPGKAGAIFLAPAVHSA